jgi:hypothetical protein
VVKGPERNLWEDHPSRPSSSPLRFRTVYSFDRSRPLLTRFEARNRSHGPL